MDFLFLKAYAVLVYLPVKTEVERTRISFKLLIKCPHSTLLPCPRHTYSPYQFREKASATGKETHSREQDSVLSLLSFKLRLLNLM